MTKLLPLLVVGLLAFGLLGMAFAKDQAPASHRAILWQDTAGIETDTRPWNKRGSDEWRQHVRGLEAARTHWYLDPVVGASPRGQKVNWPVR